MCLATGHMHYGLLIWLHNPARLLYEGVRPIGSMARSISRCRNKDACTIFLSPIASGLCNQAEIWCFAESCTPTVFSPPCHESLLLTITPAWQCIKSEGCDLPWKVHVMSFHYLVKLWTTVVLFQPYAHVTSAENLKVSMLSMTSLEMTWLSASRWTNRVPFCCQCVASTRQPAYFWDGSQHLGESHASI